MKVLEVVCGTVTSYLPHMPSSKKYEAKGMQTPDI